MQSRWVDEDGRAIGNGTRADEIRSFRSRRLSRAGDGR